MDQFVLRLPTLMLNGMANREDACTIGLNTGKVLHIKSPKAIVSTLLRKNISPNGMKFFMLEAPNEAFMNYLKGSTFTVFEDENGNIVGYRELPEDFDYSVVPLTFEALEDMTFSFYAKITSKFQVEYSLNNDSYKTKVFDNSLLFDGFEVPMKKGDKLVLKGNCPNTYYSRQLGPTPTIISNFSEISGKFNVYGNVTSLYDCTAFNNLFKGTSVVSAENLVLELEDDLVYPYAFSGCTLLIKAPKLLATTLADGCYESMFNGCTSLTTAPELPATILATDCYNSMFSGCTSLIEAPELPATILATDCYNSMFSGCTSLIEAPELPATTLVSDCYGAMFNGCTNLNYIKAMFTTEPGMTYTAYWVENVAPTGTFVKNASATWTTTGSNYGVPSGWTVETASE